MKKHEFNFRLWCRVATRKILYKPDRQQVYRELHGHLEDAYDACIAKGMTPEEAEAKVLETMGRAEDIAPQLAAIHKPFWGFVLQISQLLLIVLLVLSLIPVRQYAKALGPMNAPKPRDFEIFDSASYGGETGRTLHHLSQPDISFSSDGNRFTLTDTALFTEYSEYHQKDMTHLYILVQQHSLLPWQEHTQYKRNYAIFAPVIGQFFVRDDKGNVYPFSVDNGWTFLSKQTGIFTCTHACWINDFPADAQWAEICYERDGRSFALRVNLAGGNGK